MRCSICLEEIGNSEWGVRGCNCPNKGQVWHNKGYSKIAKELDRLGYGPEGYERNKRIVELSEILRLSRETGKSIVI